jgi:hypothetical protein
MRNFKIKVKGVTPYMQHRMDDANLQDWEKRRGKIIERDGLNDEPEKKAAFHSYINPEGDYYIPAEHFKQSFIKGGAFVKAKVGNSRKSMKNIVAGMWRIEEPEIRLSKFQEVDIRSAVNKNVKARVMVYRPKWNKWTAEFTLLIDDDAKNGVTLDTIESIVSYSGRYLGIGSYRPEHTGEFGRFEIDELFEVKRSVVE